jgi:pentatricopeptide repeat protein
VKNKRIQDAIDLFFQSDKPNEVNLIVFFNACGQAGNSKALNIGKKVFSRLLKESNGKIFNQKLLHAVFDMFIKCSDIDNVEKLFSQLHRNEMTYRSMMNMYNTRNEPKKTLFLFEQMKREKIELNEKIFVLILNAFFQLNDFIKAQELFDQIQNKSSIIYDVMLNGQLSFDLIQKQK